jgi:hypothetical protein
MSDNAIVYVVLSVGFILLILLIKFLPFAKPVKGNQLLMYYKLDLAEKKISTITSTVLEEDTKWLNANNYELIFLSDLEAFTNQKIKLPNNSFLIALNETYSYLLKRALHVLIKEQVSIIIFLPIIVTSDNEKYQQKEIQQLNEFIFSEEFKNIFSYTQLNNTTATTM